MAKTIKKKIIEEMQKRFGGLEHNLLLAQARSLDPRFKKMGYRNQPGPLCNMAADSCVVVCKPLCFVRNRYGKATIAQLIEILS